MMFTFGKWQVFLKTLKKNGCTSVTAAQIALANGSNGLILKHDVETNIKKALKMAQIESSFGFKGVFYVQAYLLNKKKNIDMLKRMTENGHEVSYHHDVMDFAKGDLNLAKIEFDKNLSLFENNGFKVITVCQHGNPLIERVGYHSNRDFFRDKQISDSYKIYDIMVNFKEVSGDFKYISDAGKSFKVIANPLTNDIDKTPLDTKLHNFDELVNELEIKNNLCILSVHPHRWFSNALFEKLHSATFAVIKFTAKTLYKIPFLKKIISKYYYLAKKI